MTESGIRRYAWLAIVLALGLGRGHLAHAAGSQEAMTRDQIKSAVRELMSGTGDERHVAFEVLTKNGFNTALAFADEVDELRFFTILVGKGSLGLRQDKEMNAGFARLGRQPPAVRLAVARAFSTVFRDNAYKLTLRAAGQEEDLSLRCAMLTGLQWQPFGKDDSFEKRVGVEARRETVRLVKDLLKRKGTFESECAVRLFAYVTTWFQWPQSARIVSRLARATTHPLAMVRRDAVAGLTRWDDGSEKARVLALLEDDEQEVREEARRYIQTHLPKDQEARARAVQSKPFWDRYDWILAPGLTYSPGVVGGEISLLFGPRHRLLKYGLVAGGGLRRAYAELEIHAGYFTLGAGAARRESGKGPQATLALPLFFIFPYARLVQLRGEDPDGPSGVMEREVGLMLKVPFGNFWRDFRM